MGKRRADHRPRVVTSLDTRCINSGARTMNTSDNTHPIDIVVQAELPDDTSSQGKTSAVAYVFSSEATLLASAPLSENGEARLKFTAAATATSLRVLVGPATTEKAPSFDELIRRGALEQHLRYNPRQP